MKEIGGYFELESMHVPEYHSQAIILNSARNALRYVIRAYNIHKLYVPFYTCPVVWDAITAENCEIIPYDIDEKFMPIHDLPDDEFVLYNNYFGVCGSNVIQLAQKHKNLIVDNAQAFFAPNYGIASIYSPRKFFGIPDGGILVCDKTLNENLETSVSYNNCSHLLKRIDLGANAGYADFQSNDESLIGQPIKKMSTLTQTLMGNINYEQIKKIRLANFNYLHQALGDKNLLKINLSKDDIPMVYPFETTNTLLRQKLIDNKIYIAKYWPTTDNLCMTSECAQNMANTIVPLPIDQRYNEQDMNRILNTMEVYK